MTKTAPFMDIAIPRLCSDIVVCCCLLLFRFVYPASSKESAVSTMWYQVGMPRRPLLIFACSLSALAAMHRMIHSVSTLTIPLLRNLRIPRASLISANEPSTWMLLLSLASIFATAPRQVRMCTCLYDRCCNTFPLHTPSRRCSVCCSRV